MIINLFDGVNDQYTEFDLPFFDYRMTVDYFRTLETYTDAKGKEKKRFSVYPVEIDVHSLVTMKSGLHAIVSKQGTAKEEPRNPEPVKREPAKPGTLLLYGKTPYTGKNLDKLNRTGETAPGENRNSESIINLAISTNKTKIEKALCEIDSILCAVSKLQRNYEYFRGMNIERYISLYIISRLKKCSHDTQDIFSETKTAIYCTQGTPEQKQKAGYKALHKYVYDFKKRSPEYCLDGETGNTVSFSRILETFTPETENTNPALRKLLKDNIKYLSTDERKTVFMLSYGYNLSDVATVLNKSISTVKTYQTKAQFKLLSVTTEPEKTETGEPTTDIRKSVLCGYLAPGTADEILVKQEREKERNRVKQAHFKARQKAKKEQEKIKA